MLPLPENITRTKAARFLHVHPATLRRWELSGRLTPIKISANRTLYRVADIERLLAEATVTP